ncbi:thiol reductant ABC exporter subunit CydC [Desulfotomaculum copahuensis]|uniref:Thiol reductant ABC exporter subunit CydC n=1 Tax=Desulfotomaculum copahuensis TaxID=1838280 RepID=A0A1B7LAQ0_9FIRM|nr:thiol reductant ABC exporter subunit CydC [Desulfotomaculum copahuensis]OAT79422.1 thiol reductant ABC exporter subunit CydC [Desulfotomaculum copahuensis]
MNTFLRLLKLIAPYRWPVLLAALLGFFSVGGNIALLAASALLIARAALHPPVVALMLLIAGVRFFGLTRAVCRYLERYVAHDVTFRVLGRMRAWFYGALEPLAPARLTEYRSGDILSRIVTDVETLQNFYLRVLAPVPVALLVLPAVFVFLAQFEFGAALAFATFFLLAGAGIPLVIMRHSREPARTVGRVRAELNARLVDGIRGMTELAAFGQAGRYREQVAALGRELAGRQGRLAGIDALGGALTSLAGNLALWAVLMLTVTAVGRGKLDWVYLPMLVLAVPGAFEAVQPLPLLFPQLEESLAAARRLFELAGARPAVRDQAGPAGGSPVRDFSGPACEPAGYDLEVAGLRFRYAPDEPAALDGLDFVLSAGGKLAVVGSSGAGKSTLINLLLRFWDYREGSIRLGGCELKTLPREQVRRLMGVVAQHTHLFNATIRENLLLARPGATVEEMIRAAREASIHEFIQNLPRGYDTYVGEGGFKLSGGQRQRLAIARALLKDAPILVLDEATAGLDPVTEREVLAAIRRLTAGRTTLVITHRLAGLEEMDEILVMDGGRVVERGTQEELLRRDGLFRRMWKLQHL